MAARPHDRRVLSIGKLGQGQADYYLQSVAQGIEDYYTGAGEAPGRWLGAAADELEVSGQVDDQALDRLLNGNRPASDQPLVERPGGTRMPGFDLTFSAPKSVSLLFGLADPGAGAEARHAHEAAVDAALGYMERQCAVARRGRAGAQSVLGNGFAAAAFRHRSSRAGDPQLHTHVLVANLTRGPDGRWSALDARRLYAHARTGGFLYEAHLRMELTRRLGVEWTPVRNGIAEIAGIPPSALRAFSRRRAEIERALAERGERSSRAAQYAALESRRAKDYGVEPEALADGWRRRAQRLGLDREQFGAVLGRGRGRSLSVQEREALTDELSSPSGLTAQRSTFTRRDVIRAWCQRVPAGAEVEAVEAMADDFLSSERAVPLAHEVSALTHSDVIRRTDGRLVRATADERRYSTPELLAQERATIEGALARMGEGAGIVDSDTTEEALRRRPTLAAEQATMVRRLTSDGDGVQVVAGRAGAGKTFALDAAREAWERAGYRVIGAAVARRAARELQDGAGIEATSLAALLADLREFGLEQRSVVVMDEAGMAGTRQLSELLDHAQRARAKVVLVGDHRQLPEIDAGGAFRALMTRLQPIELSENRRQRERWEREALDRLREGCSEEAIARYWGHGRVFVAADAEEVRDRLVRSWFEATDRGDAVMVALRRDDVADLNRRARALMGASGRLGTDALRIAERDFASGDQVVLLKNSCRLGVTNGTRAIVRAVDIDAGELELRTADGRDRRLPASYLHATTERGGPTIDHGYAITGHKAQGMTSGRAFVLGSEDLYREWGYVAMSRGREENRIYVVAGAAHSREEYAPEQPRPEELEALVAGLQRSRAQVAAIEVAAQHGVRAMTTAELIHERSSLAIHLESLAPPDRDRQLRSLAAHRAQAEHADVQAQQRVEELERERPRSTRRRESELAAARAIRAHLGHRVEQLSAQEAQLRSAVPGKADVGHHAAAVARLGAIDQQLARRRQAAARAATVARPAYLTAELGPYPERPSQRRIWRRAVTAIQTYREACDVSDAQRALGREPRDFAQRAAWRAARRYVDRVRLELGLRRQPERERDRGWGHG